VHVRPAFREESQTRAQAERRLGPARGEARPFVSELVLISLGGEPPDHMIIES
jgi:hypothetical protein